MPEEGCGQETRGAVPQDLGSCLLPVSLSFPIMEATWSPDQAACEGKGEICCRKGSRVRRALGRPFLAKGSVEGPAHREGRHCCGAMSAGSMGART